MRLPATWTCTRTTTPRCWKLYKIRRSWATTTAGTPPALSDDVSLSDDVTSCVDVQADAGFAEACTAQPQIVQDACGAKFDAVAECAYESWALEAGLDCDLDCDQVSRRRKLGVLDWARRLFSPSTKRPSTSPQAIRRKARATPRWTCCEDRRRRRVDGT